MPLLDNFLQKKQLKIIWSTVDLNFFYILFIYLFLLYFLRTALATAPQISPPKKNPKVRKGEVEIKAIFIETTILAPVFGTDQEKSGFSCLFPTDIINADHGRYDDKQQHNKGPNGGNNRGQHG